MQDAQTYNGLFGKIEQTSPDTIKAAPVIVQNIVAARAIFERLRQNHLKRIIFYTQVEGLIQGNPPYDQEELNSAGLQYIANFNDMSPRAIYERYCQAYWNLLHNSQYIINFVLRLPEAQAQDAARAMSKNWDFVVKKHWPSFHINVASLQAQLVKFGVSPLLFPDERDPRWRVVELSKFYVPDQAQSDLDMLTTICVETEFTVQYLYGIYQEFKDKREESPWEIGELGRLLVFLTLSPGADPMDPSDWFDLERRLYSGDICFDNMYSNTVKIVSQFQKEYNGKISHYMFHRFYNYGAQTASEISENFIFFQKDQYHTMRDAIVIFTMNPGEYTIHANRGLGHKIFSLAQAKLMVDCSVVDMARWASTPILKSSSLNDKDVEQIRFYPGVPTNIGTAEFVQNSLGANIENVIGAAQYLQSAMQYNLTYSGSDPASPDPSNGSLSPSQVRLQAFQEFSVLKNYIMHFYSTFDPVLENMTKKILFSQEGWPMHDMAKEWKELCMADGVPEEVFTVTAEDREKNQLPSIIRVQATRAAGAGSQVALLTGLQELQSIAGSFTTSEAREYKKLFVSASIGSEYLDTFAQEPEPDEASGGSSLAGVENGLMQLGKSPIFSQDNEHRAHAITHLTLLREIAGLTQSGDMDLVDADTIFNVGVPHTEMHMRALQADPFAVQTVQQIKPLFDEIVKYAILNNKNAERALQKREQDAVQAAENQDRVMSEEELKNFQAMKSEERSDLKLQAQNQRQERAGQFKEQALVAKTRTDIAIETAKAENEILTKQRKAAAETQDKRRSSTVSTAEGNE